MNAPDNCSPKYIVILVEQDFEQRPNMVHVGMRVVSTQQRRGKHPNHESSFPLTRNCQCDSDTVAEVFPRHMLSTHARMYSPNILSPDQQIDLPLYDFPTLAAIRVLLRDILAFGAKVVDISHSAGCDGLDLALGTLHQPPRS